MPWRLRTTRRVVGPLDRSSLPTTNKSLAACSSTSAAVSRMDAGEIDVFELDDLIHRYKKCAAKLWSFCGSSGGQWLQAARNLAYLREQGDEPDWWEVGVPRRDE